MLRVFEHVNVTCITPHTFFRHQTSILIPAVNRVWVEEQKCVIASLQAERREIVLGGDGRADSPSHCAKYGSYTMLGLKANLVVDVQLVQSNECGGSYYMEKEGLCRSVGYLQAELMLIDILITDHHRQIAKWIADNFPQCQYLYDIWHVARGLIKNLYQLSREKV